ncbi:hypothetical protein J6590_101462 [Homalodisca vitripennis]|nr:hypothetical protein J6590_101462 [Homalodisca vitripennis]
MYLVRLASGIVYKRHVDQLIAVDTAPVTDQTAEVITAESQQTARSDCADDSPVGSNRTADAPRHSISVRPSTAMSPNASHTHTTYSSPITQRSPLARSTPVRRYPQRERKPITRLDFDRRINPIGQGMTLLLNLPPPQIPQSSPSPRCSGQRYARGRYCIHKKSFHSPSPVK